MADVCQGWISDGIPGHATADWRFPTGYATALYGSADGGEGERSLGTIRVAEVLSVTTRRNREDGLDMRLAFRDASGETYKLTIADLLAQGYLALRTGDGYTPQQLARSLRLALQRQRLLYLRIGLVEPTESEPDRCYLQITGMITGQTASQAYGDASDTGVGIM